jgi:hypothetical protein
LRVYCYKSINLILIQSTSSDSSDVLKSAILDEFSLGKKSVDYLMNPHRANQLAAALGAKLGIDELCFSATDSCQLVFDQRWVVTLIHESSRQRITLNCPIGATGHCDHLSRGALLTMLKANFMEQGCPGASLSVGQDRRAYIQTVVSTPEALDNALHTGLEMLLNQAEHWETFLTQDQETQAPRTVASAGWKRQRV